MIRSPTTRKSGQYSGSQMKSVDTKLRKRPENIEKQLNSTFSRKAGSEDENTNINCICLKCNRKVKNNQKGIQCEYCDIWFHITCEKLTDDEYKKLNDLDEKASWYCSNCSFKIKEMKNEIIVLNNERNQMNKQNSDMSDAIKRMQEELNEYYEKTENSILEKINHEMKEYKMIIHDEIIRRTDEQMKNYHQKKLEEFNEKLSEEIIISKNNIKEEILQKFNEENSSGWNRWNKVKDDVNQTRSENRNMQETIKKLRTDLRQMEERVEDIGKNSNNLNKNFPEGKNNDQIIEKYGEILTENNNLKMKVDNIEKKIENTKLNENTKYSDQEAIKVRVEECMRNRVEEERLKEYKKNNVIIFNLKESLKSEAEEREQDDSEVAFKIFEEEMKVTSFYLQRSFRIGKKSEDNNKPRPLLVELGSEKEKWAVIGKTANLRNSTKFGVIYVNRDMTKDEQELEKQLREELKGKREQGEEGWKIKKGKVVREMESYKNSNQMQTVFRRNNYIGKNYRGQGRGIHV